MLTLSDDELSIVMSAAKPLQSTQRSQFLEAVGVVLSSMPAGSLGPGPVSSVVRELQRAHFKPPPAGSEARSRRRAPA